MKFFRPDQLVRKERSRAAIGRVPLVSHPCAYRSTPFILPHVRAAV